MRIAFTGACSTGKSTLAESITSDSTLLAKAGIFITADARRILRELGHTNVDAMSIEEKRQFQFAYLERKLLLELGRTHYFTDRSFVDLASYWIEYLGGTLSDQDEYIAQCRSAATRYDAHFYFPSALIPLQSDGYRSTDEASRTRTDVIIKEILQAWNIPAVELSILDLDTRRAQVAEVLQRGTI